MMILVVGLLLLGAALLVGLYVHGLRQSDRELSEPVPFHGTGLDWDPYDD